MGILFKEQKDRLNLVLEQEGTFMSLGLLPLKDAPRFAAGHPDIGWIGNKPEADGVEPYRLRVVVNDSEDFYQTPFLLVAQGPDPDDFKKLYYLNEDRAKIFEKYGPDSLFENGPIDWEAAGIRKKKQRILELQEEISDLQIEVAAFENKRQEPRLEADDSPTPFS